MTDLPSSLDGADRQGKRPMALLFVVVFISLMGFGIVLPVFPFFGRVVGASPEEITVAMAAYSLGQFIGAPLWGRLSDKIGRRPVLFWSLLGSAGAYVVMGHAGDIYMLGLSRLIGGLMAGNIAAAFAYIGDITTEETRAKSMGLLGAAFALGFIFGPAIGGLIAGDESGGQDLLIIGYASAAITLVAALLAIFVLPESLPPERRNRPAPQDGKKGAAMGQLFRQKPVILWLCALVFLVIGASALMESTFAFFASDRFAWGPRSVGLIFGLIGIISAALQAGATGPVVKRLGERKVVLLALVFYIAGLSGLAVANNDVTVVIALAITACGIGLFSPSYQSLVSSFSHDGDRGLIMGITQGASSLGRVVGPAISGTLYVAISQAAPFLIGAAAVAAAFLITLGLQRYQPLGAAEVGQ